VEDAHYLVRAQAVSDGMTSNGGNWASCDMWIDVVNSAPGALAILSPSSGASFPSATQSVPVQVQDGGDAESLIPGSDLVVALCASVDPAFGDCDPSPRNWQVAPSIGDPTRTTNLMLTQLASGAPLGPDLAVYLQACALDEGDLCGPMDTTDFVIEAPPPTCAEVICPSGESCDPATLVCIVDTILDGGSQADGGLVDPKTGCCQSDSLPRGEHGLALASLLGLLLLGTRRRR